MAEWHLIPSGRVWVDPGGPFGLVPRALWGRTQQANEHGLVPMDLTCMLIFSEGKTILVDTGLGDKLDEKGVRQWNLEYPQGRLLENLAAHGVRPQDVDIVLDTHLHGDHCSGNTTLIDGQLAATFPKAEYWVQRLEFADAMHTNERTRATYLPENYVPLWEQGKLRLLHGDTQVTKEVRCVVTPGHTRAMQCILYEGDPRPLLYVADLTSYAVHMERRAWVTAYDVEPLETIRTKGYWQDWALETQATLVFEHDTTMPLGTLTRTSEGKLKVQAAASAPTED
jgi:glyoxylase-like metal-dependent hydrolase (beta-lactamase superfamily II)